MEAVEEFTTVESIFLREKNCLLLRADFSPIFTDYYLHLMEIKERHPEGLDTTLKELIASLTLHLTARPWAETIAWTANLRAPRANFFATGSSTGEYITGRLFTKDVREPDRNFLYSQTTKPGAQPQLSTIEVETASPLEWTKHFYDQSEQRPGKIFALSGDSFAMVAAQPDFDEEWFAQITAEELETITETAPHKVLETRRFRFDCGCTLERILPTLRAWRDKPEELFGKQEAISIQCPRCGKKYTVTRDDLKSED
ncbi:Hsp33 family molecular chaperone HslO [Akkermansiaceae bacterium]|nr:Hsp33 family molecular chaperone HslO [Akkermansiaceae bacterium]MDB4302706.1 Hsp33 family molecular chaperone HslO [bacterium]MDA7538330.1 Hsp33 family molecular chaperone HslO [Akkermansiaceae bacterium]MDA7672546.1 Hsp33 family molecular chaperone HslO [Akkermansiaceae bacterium]MDB4284118.1 Hsp33 family molecular chaperone HslO [Akkermansiaceae bacterium]